MTPEQLEMAMQASEESAAQIVADWQMGPDAETIAYDSFLFGVYWAEQNLLTK